MPSKTPPKGRPTPGRVDRQVAVRRSRSRSRTKKFVWALLAVAVLGAILILGSGTGGNAIDTTNSGLVPLLTLSGARLSRSGRRASRP